MLLPSIAHQRVARFPSVALLAEYVLLKDELALERVLSAKLDNGEGEGEGEGDGVRVAIGEGEIVIIEVGTKPYTSKS